MSTTKNNRKSRPKGRGLYPSGLVDAVKSCGNFRPEEVLPYFEEQLTVNENEILEGFLSWMTENDKVFGTATIDKVFAEYRKTL